MGAGMMMGPGHAGGGGMMRGGPMAGMGGPMTAPMAPPVAPGPDESATSLRPAAKSALLRALDEEYRAEALYEHIASQLGPRRPVAMIARAEHRHAWVLESLALAHGVDLPPNQWRAAKQPDLANLTAACRAGVDSERKTMATYDELAKVDLPPDLQRAFAHLRAASAEHHLPAFEACK